MTAHPRAPRVHHLNSVRLRDCPSAAELEALCDRWQPGGAVRRVVIEDGGAGETVAGTLQTRGWHRDRVVVMALGRAARVRPPDPRAGQVTEAELVALERRILVEDTAGLGDRRKLCRQISLANAAMRAGTACRRFLAGDGVDTEPAAMATLFLDGDTALVESIGTLRMWREQGLGNAVLGAALHAARAAGATAVGIITDADDWPQVWYAGLGFEPVRRHVAYMRTAADSGGSQE